MTERIDVLLHDTWHNNVQDFEVDDNGDFSFIHGNCRYSGPESALFGVRQYATRTESVV